MSFAPSYKYISAEVRVVTHIVELELELIKQELAEMIKTKSAKELKEFAVVDVRDSDFVVSHLVRKRKGQCSWVKGRKYRRGSQCS